jgi:hypothetical protein
MDLPVECTWHVAFTTHPRYADGSASRPWFRFDRPKDEEEKAIGAELIASEGFGACAGGGTVLRGVLQKTPSSAAGSGEYTLAPLSASNRDGSHSWHANISSMFSNGGADNDARLRVISTDDKEGVLAFCASRTLTLQDASCHVLLRDPLRHTPDVASVAGHPPSPAGASTAVAAAMQRVAEAPEFQKTSGRWQPAAGSPFSEDHTR